eukprot:403059-Prymnesium_polylepis.1
MVNSGLTEQQAKQKQAMAQLKAKAMMHVAEVEKPVSNEAKTKVRRARPRRAPPSHHAPPSPHRARMACAIVRFARRRGWLDRAARTALRPWHASWCGQRARASPDS